MHEVESFLFFDNLCFAWRPSRWSFGQQCDFELPSSWFRDNTNFLFPSPTSLKLVSEARRFQDMEFALTYQLLRLHCPVWPRNLAPSTNHPWRLWYASWHLASNSTQSCLWNRLLIVIFYCADSGLNNEITRRYGFSFRGLHRIIILQKQQSIGGGHGRTSLSSTDECPVQLQRSLTF